jgi:hypothetical protein
MLVLVLAFVASMVPLFGQNYVDRAKYQYQTGTDSYRTLTLEKTRESWQLADYTNYVVFFGKDFCHGGTDAIVEIVTVDDRAQKDYDTKKAEYDKKIKANPKDTTAQKPIPPFTKGQKINVKTFDADTNNQFRYEYRVRTPGPGYRVEFGMYRTIGNNQVKGTKFGVILPNSSVLFTSGRITVESGAIGWDDDFETAMELDIFMESIAKKVNYDFVKKTVDDLNNKKYTWNNNKCPIDAKNCLCKGNLDEHLIINVSAGAGIWGALWGALPPYFLPVEFANVQAQFTAQAHLAAAIGYNHGYYPKSGAEFVQQLKLDNYVLFAGMDSGSNNKDTVIGMGQTVAQETIQKATTLILTKIAPKGVSAVPVIGTVWGIGYGAYTGSRDALAMGRRAVNYYSKPMATFSFDKANKKITGYNGSDTNVTIPPTIDGVQVQSIGSTAFKENKQIISVTIGSNVTRIDGNAFLNCTKLTSVTIPGAVKEIWGSAFSGCTSLSKVSISTKTVTWGDDNVFKGTKLNDASKSALRNLGYEGAGVGKGATGVTFGNVTGTDIQIIERKDGSNWATVYAGGLHMNNKTVVTLAPGKYNLRARTAAPFPQCTTFVKNGVEVKDGMTITFNANEKYKPTRAEYQEFIQLKCGFSNVNDVWKAMNTHPNADDLYRMWAESYPYNSNGAPPSSRPAKKTDQEIIKEKCKFSDSQAKAVWDAAAKHSNAKALLQKWADSYFRK